MRLSDFDYPLPESLVAQEPVEPRDASRLLALDRATGAIGHRRFTDLPGLLRPGDLLIVNDTRVLPARTFARMEGRGAGGPAAGGRPGVLVRLPDRGQ